MNIEPNPELQDRIIAGRRAAHIELQAICIRAGWNYHGVPPECLNDIFSTRVGVNGVDFTSAIDAAILETMVWAQDPQKPTPKRKWWRFW